MDITERYLQIEKEVLRIQTILSERAKVYDKFVEECIAKGINPDTLQEELKTLAELIEQKKTELSAQLDVIENELTEFRRAV